MKKGLSILLALTLLVSMLVPVPVFGTSGDVGQETTITVTGGVTTIGTYGQVLGGRLPTAANLDFTIDPMNLAGLAVDAIVDVTSTNNAVNFGANNVLRTWNTSSVPVLLTAALTVTGDASPVMTEAAVTSGDTAAVLMWMQPNATIQNTETAAFNGAARVIPFASTVNAHFRLPAIPHNLHVVDNTVNPIAVELRPAATAADLNGTAFSFGGIINTRNAAAIAAWGDVTAIGVSAVFSMTAITDPTSAAATADYRRTDGDVIAEGMLATYGSFTAPALIAVPEGGAIGAGLTFATADVWIVLETITSAPAWVARRTGAADAVFIPNTAFQIFNGALIINIPGGSFAPGAHTIYVESGGTHVAFNVTVTP